MKDVQLEFLGGASAIGASACLVTVGNTRILVDCGVRFVQDRPLPELSRLQDIHLDAIVVTHAHSDHTGGLAVVHSLHPGTPIYLTSATAELVRILQLDALKIMDSQEREKEIPLFHEEQVHSMLQACVPVNFGENVTVNEVRFTWLPAGHILGAAMLYIETPAGHLLFTGDYSVRGQLTVPNLKLPRLPVNILITESTYGNRMHDDRRLSEERLIRRIAEIVEEGGRVLIPAFAIGRAQEVLTILRRAMKDRKLPHVPVYVDGMVRAVCQIYARFPNDLSRLLRHEIMKSGQPFFDSKIQAVRPEQRKDLPPSEPCVIVASSGMLSGGPSAAYAAKMIDQERDAILITGYQDEESPGRKLLKLAQSSESAEPMKRSIVLSGQEREVKCQFETFQLSAHADKTEILGLVNHVRPQTVVLVHGDDDARESLQQLLKPMVKEVIMGDEVDSLSRSFSPRRKAAELALETFRKGLESRAGHFEVKATDIERAVDHPVEASTGEAKQRIWTEAKSRLLQARKIKNLQDIRFLSREVGMRAKSRVFVTLEDGSTLEAPTFEGSSLGSAESLAASWALEQLTEPVPGDEIQDTDEMQVSSPRSKGEIFEICMKAAVPGPTVRHEMDCKGFLVQAAIEFDGFSCASLWMRSRSLKEAELAAFANLLDTLETKAKDWPLDAFLCRHKRSSTNQAHPETLQSSLSPQPKIHPTSQLSQWEQKGVILSFCTEFSASGPAHAPIFSGYGEVRLPASVVLKSERLSGTSKKSLQKRLHADLVERVKDFLENSK